MNTINQLKTVKVKSTGAYADRVFDLLFAFQGALDKMLGSRISPEENRADPKDPIYYWDLPDNVSVTINRSGKADPRIWVRRDDPISQPPDDTDLKNEHFDRNYEDKLYHVGKIVLYIKGQMEYNRKKREEHDANRKAKGKELHGVMVPDGVTVERNPKTGFYEVFMRVQIKELSGEEIKIAVAACRDFKKAVEPFAKKETSNA